MFSNLSLSKDDTCRHTTYNPRTSLYDSTLCMRQIDFFLVNWLSHFVSSCTSTKVGLSCFNELIIAGKIATEEDTHTFSSKNWLANPRFILDS